MFATMRGLQPGFGQCKTWPVISGRPIVVPEAIFLAQVERLPLPVPVKG